MKKFRPDILIFIMVLILLSAGSLFSQEKKTESKAQIYVEVVLIQASRNGGVQIEYPAEIEKAVGKMRSLFNFTKYEIIGRADALGWEDSTIMFSSGEAPAKTVPVPDRERPPVERRLRWDSVPSATEAFFEVSATLRRQEKTIILEDLGVHVERPRPSMISATYTIKDGDTLILGASRGNVEDDSLITILTARIIDDPADS